MHSRSSSIRFIFTGMLSNWRRFIIPSSESIGHCEKFCPDVYWTNTTIRKIPVTRRLAVNQQLSPGPLVTKPIWHLGCLLCENHEAFCYVAPTSPGGPGSC